MMADMYGRMTTACQKKCVPPKYKDAELNKGEAVCLDRCVAKYLDIHERIGKKTNIYDHTRRGNHAENAGTDAEIGFIVIVIGLYYSIPLDLHRFNFCLLKYFMRKAQSESIGFPSGYFMRQVQSPKVFICMRFLLNGFTDFSTEHVVNLS